MFGRKSRQRGTRLNRSTRLPHTRKRKRFLVFPCLSPHLITPSLSHPRPRPCRRENRKPQNDQYIAAASSPHGQRDFHHGQWRSRCILLVLILLLCPAPRSRTLITRRLRSAARPGLVVSRGQARRRSDGTDTGADEDINASYRKSTARLRVSRPLSSFFLVAPFKECGTEFKCLTLGVCDTHAQILNPVALLQRREGLSRPANPLPRRSPHSFFQIPETTTQERHLTFRRRRRLLSRLPKIHPLHLRQTARPFPRGIRLRGILVRTIPSGPGAHIDEPRPAEERKIALGPAPVHGQTDRVVPRRLCTVPVVAPPDPGHLRGHAADGPARPASDALRPDGPPLAALHARAPGHRLAPVGDLVFSALAVSLGLGG